MVIVDMSINSERVRSDDRRDFSFPQIINQNPSLAEGIMDKFKTIINNLESEFGENFEDNCCKISDEYNLEDLELGLELYDVKSPNMIPNMGDYLKRIKNFKDRLSQYESKLKRAKEQRMNLRTRLSNKTKKIKEKLSKKLKNIKRSLRKRLRRKGGGKKRHTKKRHTKKRHTKKRHTKKRHTKKRHTKKRMP